jgi:hypothetical protein
MKRVFFLFAALLFINSPLQAKEIVGIGEFKIGMSLSDFLGLAEIQGKSSIERPKSEGLIGSYFALMLFPTKEEMWKEERLSDGIVEFTFNTPLGDKQDDKTPIHLVFYEKKLASTRVFPGVFGAVEMLKILSDKYGEPSRHIKNSKTVVCTDPTTKQVKSDLEGYDLLIWETPKVRGTFTQAHAPCQVFLIPAWNGYSYKVADKHIESVLLKKRKPPESGSSKL